MNVDGVVVTEVIGVITITTTSYIIGHEYFGLQVETLKMQK